MIYLLCCYLFQKDKILFIHLFILGMTFLIFSFCLQLCETFCASKVRTTFKKYIQKSLASITPLCSFLLSPFRLLEWKNHKLGDLNKKHQLLIVPEAGKSKIKDLPELVSGESSFPGSQVAIFSLCPHMSKGIGTLSWVSFIKVLIPLVKASPSCPKQPPTSYFLISSHGRLVFQHMNFWCITD